MGLSPAAPPPTPPPPPAAEAPRCMSRWCSAAGRGIVLGQKSATRCGATHTTWTSSSPAVGLARCGTCSPSPCSRHDSLHQLGQVPRGERLAPRAPRLPSQGLGLARETWCWPKRLAQRGSRATRMGVPTRRTLSGWSFTLPGIATCGTSHAAVDANTVCECVCVYVLMCVSHREPPSPPCNPSCCLFLKIRQWCALQHSS